MQVTKRQLTEMIKGAVKRAIRENSGDADGAATEIVRAAKAMISAAKEVGYNSGNGGPDGDDVLRLVQRQLSGYDDRLLRVIEGAVNEGGSDV